MSKKNNPSPSDTMPTQEAADSSVVNLFYELESTKSELQAIITEREQLEIESNEFHTRQMKMRESLDYHEAKLTLKRHRLGDLIRGQL